MREYSGAVLFIDILGFGALTSGHGTISVQDFLAHGFSDRAISNQMFSAFILSKFRKQLIEVRDKSDKVSVSQLSDCAFIWSSDADAVLEFARDIMWKLSSVGVFCRAGLSYGEILEPEKTALSIGDYICGSAVTKAVRNEGMGKGARVFVDEKFPSQCSPYQSDAFKPRISKVDYRIVDEFCWFLYPNPMEASYPSHQENAKKERARFIIELVGKYLYDPRYSWNTISRQGTTQIAATIDIIATSYNELDIGSEITFTFEHIINGDIERKENNIVHFVRSMLSEK